jgi:hypothetical protein
MDKEMTFQELSDKERSEAIAFLGTQMIHDIVHDNFAAEKVSDNKYWLDTILRVKQELGNCEGDSDLIHGLYVSAYTLCSNEIISYLVKNIIPNTTFSRRFIDTRSIPVTPNVNARDN